MTCSVRRARWRGLGQRLALAHMQTELAIETRWQGWHQGKVWSGQMAQDIHQDLFARSHDGYYAHLAAADEPRAGDLNARGNLSERALVAWISYVLGLCLDQVRFIASQLDMSGMKVRIAACLAFEENAAKAGVRSESLRALHYLLLTQSELERCEFKALQGLGGRLKAPASQISACLGLFRAKFGYFDLEK